jgi:hypothetical protein
MSSYVEGGRIGRKGQYRVHNTDVADGIRTEELLYATLGRVRTCLLSI